MDNVLPILFLLACPLMMIFMMKGMHGGGHGGGDRRHDRSAAQDQRDRRISELEKEVAQLRADRRARDDSAAAGQGRAER